MERLPVLMELHWNEELNRGKIWDVLQHFSKEDKFYWNCFSCGGSRYETVESFIKRVSNQPKSQFNTVCKNCKSVSNITSDIHYLSKISLSMQLKEFLRFNLSLSQYEIVFRCPVCGKYKSSHKTTMFHKYHSLICGDCVSLESKKVLTDKTMSQLYPGKEKCWGQNFTDFYHTIPVIYKQKFNLICPTCGKMYTKSYDAIVRSGFNCSVCAKRKTDVGSCNSLRAVYPELAIMWDRGGNEFSSDKIPKSSTITGRFMCNAGGKPHIFTRQVSVVVEEYKKGYTGCPICYNREVYTGINDFSTKFPEAVRYWDYKNNNFPPEKSIVTKQTKFAMICPRCRKSHTKRTDAIERNGAYCEKCASIKNNLSEENSLLINYPNVAKMWDNGGNNIKSKDLTVSSHVKGRFLCTGKRFGGREHLFIRSVSDVVNSIKNGSSSNGCPICAGFKVASGVNDFKTICHKGAKLWDYSKNTLKPEEVYYKSEKNFFFICPNGHSFEKDLLHMVRSENTSACGCPVCAGREVRKGVNDLATTIPDTVDRWCYDLNTITPYEVTAGSNKIIKARCRVCGDVYETEVYNWCHNLVVACEKCRKRQFSIAEKELCEEIRSWGFHVEENKRLTGDARTYDMYIPEKNIAIEYNGLYYHSDAVRVNSNYHFEKCLDCLQNGIDLIQIWEDDYIFKKPIVLSFLKRKLGVSNEEKVNARDCEPMFIDVRDAREFLDLYHIQGFVSGSKYVGLCDKDSNIMAVIVLEKNKKDNSILIKRYASCCNVRGGFSKLVASIKEVFEDCDSVYTFSDNTISFGDLYKNNGFESKQFLPPDYKYVVAGRRVHKFNYRKERFKSDPNLYYEEGLTEEELAEENGLIRVYDAGKIKWYREL